MASTAVAHAPTTAPLTMPTTAPLTMPTQPLQDPKIEALAAMFPDIDKEVLGLMLTHTNGNVEAAIDMILDVPAAPPAATATPQPATEGMSDEEMARMIQRELDAADRAPAGATAAETADAATARQLQAEQDVEVAKALHASLQQELQSEQDEARRQQIRARQEEVRRSVGNAASGAKSFLARLSGGLGGRSRANSGSTSSTHGVRLLDAADQGGTNGGYDTTPLSITAINTPLSAEYAPPLVAAASPTSSPSAAAAPAATPAATPAADAPAPKRTTDGSADSLDAEGRSSRYSSRMERARSHNLRQRSATSPPNTSPPGPAPQLSSDSAPDASSIAPLNLLDMPTTTAPPAPVAGPLVDLS